MPISYDLSLVVDSMRADHSVGPLTVDARTDVAARLKHVAIGELVEQHRAKPWTDRALVLPGHLHLHRIAVTGGRQTARGAVELSVRLTVLSDVASRRELVEQRLTELGTLPTWLPRSKARLSLRSWTVVDTEGWSEIFAPCASDGRGSVDVVISAALLRRRHVWKAPTVETLLDAASWNLRRLLRDEGWITEVAIELPVWNCSELVTVDSDVSTHRLVDATYLASAATKQTERNRVEGLTGRVRLTLDENFARRTAAHAWLRAFALTGLGSYGTSGAGSFTVARTNAEALVSAR